MATLQVYEFEKLLYDDEKYFTKKHWESLCVYHSRQGQHSNFFKIIHRGVQFTNFVGTIRVRNLTIEILPKTDKDQTKSGAFNSSPGQDSSTSEKMLWKYILLDMLRTCKYLKVYESSDGKMKLQNSPILDFYIEQYLSEVQTLLNAGLAKQYQKIEENIGVVKGKIQYTKQFSKNLVNQHLFYVKYAKLTLDNPLNKTIKQALEIVKSLTANRYLIDRSTKLLFHFENIQTGTISPESISRLKFSRSTEVYKPGIKLAEILLFGLSPGLRSGTNDVRLFLFDMNKLWEEFIFWKLKNVADLGTVVSRQNSKQFWHNRSEDLFKYVRPDILVQKKGITIVIDTKWKQATQINVDNDLKQMFVYNLLWNSQKSVLLYPGNMEKLMGSYLHFPLSRTGEIGLDAQYQSECSIQTINLVTEEGKLPAKSYFERFLENL